MTSFETDSLGTGRAEAGIPPPAVMPALAPALSGGVSNDLEWMLQKIKVDSRLSRLYI